MAFYVADKLDLFKPHGLDVDLQFFNDPALIPTAMVSRALDGGMLTDQVGLGRQGLEAPGGDAHRLLQRR